MSEPSDNPYFDSRSPYAVLYAALAQVRERFHREGRLGDANAKLDEAVKLIAIHYGGAKGLLPPAEYRALRDPTAFTVQRLQAAFEIVARSAPFRTPDGTSIFGSRPHTAFEPGDEEIAFELLSTFEQALSLRTTDGRAVDVLNEAFGHFVRDNFRSHIDDAQYMTPTEVVDFMVQLAAHWMSDDKAMRGRDRMIMVDPSCGVGSFLHAWRRTYDRDPSAGLPPLAAIGQDKVERMVTLAMMNLILSGCQDDIVYSGNSLVDGSALERFDGQVDLILTNPPFGAMFPAEDVRAKSRRATPTFAQTSLGSRAFPSELMFIDRYLTLLRPGGLCLAVVPDSVISARGVAAFARQYLGRAARLLAVVELPPVTFAQAGTRTKTAVLCFRKEPTPSVGPYPVFFGEAEHIGFEVSKRGGVPTKREAGTNQLPNLLGTLTRRGSDSTTGFVAGWHRVDPTRLESWTPRQFGVDPERIRDEVDGATLEMTPLSQLVEMSVRRRVETWRPGQLFISVLHVLGEGLLDLAAVAEHRPVTPGFPVSPGEVIVSRINPRIPRILVVPDLKSGLLCSAEFEILVPKSGVSAFALAYVLRSEVVQRQILALTAGTSASHSRVKPRMFCDIQVPWPRAPNAAPKFDAVVTKYALAMETLVASTLEVSQLRSVERDVLGGA
jgi:type I restriction-modification system DNA methylase subunit